MSEPNWSNRTLWTGDNLPILRGMNSESVDLVYLDPPFNSNRTYAAPVGSKAARAAFKDTWRLSDLDEAWHNQIADRNLAAYKVIEASGYCHGNGMKSYLVMMAVRLLEMHRILKPTGSMYLHCDPVASHYLKLLMDAIFMASGGHFRNEIVWCYTGPGSPKMRQFNRKHDTILWYSKGDRWVFNRDDIRLPYKDHLQRPRKAFDTGHVFSADNVDRMRRSGKVPETWWVDFAIVARFKSIDKGGERTGYPTQKPLALLERILKASSNEGDVVLDPFCGCATACVAAEKLQRRWAGMNISPRAVELVNMRLRQLYHLPLLPYVVEDRTDVPARTDLGPPPPLVESRKILYGQQEGYCNGCGHHFLARNLTVDHIIPRGNGGTSHRENLQLLCQACNSMKGARPMEYLRVRLAQLTRPAP